MLTFDDCLSLCSLSEKEITAIAEHEHLPEMAALEYGEYLLHTANGESRIECMIIEDIEHSKSCGNIKHAKALEAVLENFISNHPKLRSQTHTPPA